ncbi:MAG: LacI family DNA-binding transcriptional regulator [Treponema sp.]|jgi:LacI family transcriptional regulator|nr:LacI family DNA-binding transcriptional regulator [Treponema sp.]
MTMHEIAALAGVSIGTVDRVLHKRGRVSAATREKVEGIIDHYRFIPNPIARRLKRGRAYRFCALIPRRDQDAGYWAQALEGIEAGAAELRPLGAETEILEYDRYSLGEAWGMLDRALAADPDGMIFAPIVLIKPLLEKVRERGIPCVFFDSDFPGVNPLCRIRQDPVRGGYLAGRLMHLFMGTEKRPMGVLNIHSQDYHIIKRRDGFVRYAEEQGVPTVVRDYAGEEELSGAEMGRFLEDCPDLAGVFVTNCLAHRVARTLKSRRRGDLFIIGYDLIPGNRRLLEEGFMDAVIAQRPEEQGRRSVLALYRHIALEEPVEPEIDIPLDIYVRENIPGERS